MIAAVMREKYVSLLYFVLATLQAKIGISASECERPKDFQLKGDVLVEQGIIYSVFLEKCKTKTIYLPQLINDATGDVSLSITVTPTTLPLQWNITRASPTPGFGNVNETTDVESTLQKFEGKMKQTYEDDYPEPGFLYKILLRSVSGETCVRIKVNLTPKILQLPIKQPKVDVTFRKISDKLVVKWEHSHLNLEGLKYCIVASRKKFYNSANELTQNISDMDLQARKREVGDYFSITRDTETNVMDRQSEDNLVCVSDEKRVLEGLSKGSKYFVTIFATDATKTTVPFAKTTILYGKPGALRDGKPSRGKIGRKGNNILSFRYKVSRLRGANSGNDIWWYVRTCGATVDAEIRRRKEIVLVRPGIDKYARIIIRDYIPGERYVVRITLAQAQECKYLDKNLRQIHVFATIRPKMFPFPEPPASTEVVEYLSERDETSATIGWSPLQVQRGTPVTYCIYIFELEKNNEKIRRDDDISFSQCYIEKQIRKRNIPSGNIICLEIFTNDTSNNVIQRIGNLDSAYEYKVHVTAKTHKKRRLHYNYLTISDR